MPLLRGFDSPRDYRGGFVAIGNFDGVHRGHQAMISTLVAQARAASVPAVVLTFDPHPITLLRPGQTPPRLSTIARKSELLHHHGVDTVIAWPTDRSLLELSPTEFFEQFILDQLQARGLVEGPNFFFGRNREGTVETLRRFCDQSGLSLTVVDPVEIEGRMVSSSVIRQLIGDGEMNEAVRLLGHPYRLRGTVIKGAGRGRELGFPTANLSDIATLIPGDGVYFAATRLGQQDRCPAAVHVGPNPSFSETDRKVEVHIVGQSGDLYGSTLDVDFLGRLRDVRPFSSREELTAQLQRDVAAAVQAVADSEGSEH